MTAHYWKRLRKLDSSDEAALGCSRSPRPELAMDVISAALSPSSVPNAPSRCEVLDWSACEQQQGALMLACHDRGLGRQVYCPGKVLDCSACDQRHEALTLKIQN